MAKKIVGVLNQEVANFSVLYEKLHHYHWFVKGENFFTLHEKFQEDYEEVTGLVDELAERIIMIGGEPVSTLAEYLSITTIEENQKEAKNARDMVSLLKNDYKTLVTELKVAVVVAGEEDDSVTEDLLIGILASFEKKIWFYKAFLG